MNNWLITQSNFLKREKRLANEARGQIGGLRFDWAMVVLSSWFLGGLFLDGWAHTHGQVDKSFFTPWHAVLYSGHLAVTTFLIVTLIRNLVRGYAWRRALPAGYGLSLLGGVLFGLGGIGDLIWHTLFGIEKNVEALISPTHLVLAASGFLIYTGPLRAAWRKSNAETKGLAQQLPMLLSFTFTLSLLTFFTQIAHPIANLWGAEVVAPTTTDQLKEQGVISILLDTALLMGAVLLLVRRWSLAPGALSIIFTLNAVAMGFLYDQGAYPLAHVAARAAAGLVADVLLVQLKPSEKRPSALRWFAFGVPSVVFGLYFLTTQITTGISWTVHLWAGSVVMAGVVGLLVSFLAVPPADNVQEH
jgi:hypothetical protein